MCLPIGSKLLRSKILWMKHVVFWREPDGVIPRATGDWLTGRWDSRKVLRHCHNTWKTSTCTRRCWSSRCWHSDWKSGLFPDFYRKYSKVRTFPGPGRPCFKISTFPGNKDRVGTMLLVQIIACPLTRQAIIWTTAGILLIGALATNFNEISIKLLHTRLHSIYHDEISTLFLYIELRNSRPNNQVSIKSALD